MTMAENGRMGLVPKVIGSYKKLMSAHRKETVVSVTIAEVRHVNVTLLTLFTGDNRRRTRTAARFAKYCIPPPFKSEGLCPEKKIGTDRSIAMEMEVDPELIGGLIVEWDDAYRMDLSVASSIKRLEAELLDAF